MRGNFIRKLLVILIVIIPIFSSADCKKQAKCGCNGDVLFSLTQRSSTVYWTDGATISFTTLDDPYSTYNFCNPSEMFSKLADSKSGDILMVTGQVFWDCNYLYQSSNYSYQSYYKVYQINVTELSTNLYGKK